VYGIVTQFDAATGTMAFRANVSGVRQSAYYNYTDNCVFVAAAGEESKLADVVQGDLFVAEVTVSGSFSYDTQIGGNTTVPSFVIATIVVTGHRG
jgi:hypothetical protein